MDSPLITVSCSFCNKEIKSPENMKDAEKHACFECFQNLVETASDEEREKLSKIHVDAPRDKFEDFMATALVEALMNDVFPELWKEAKLNIKEMSKREIAENMFITGAEAAMHAIFNAQNEHENVDDKDDSST